MAKTDFKDAPFINGIVVERETPLSCRVHIVEAGISLASLSMPTESFMRFCQGALNEFAAKKSKGN